jgi:hypothetical protein
MNDGLSANLLIGILTFVWERKFQQFPQTWSSWECHFRFYDALPMHNTQKPQTDRFGMSTIVQLLARFSVKIDMKKLSDGVPTNGTTAR